MDLYSSLCTITKEENILRDEPMCRHTTFRVGGPADYFVTPQSVEEIRGILAVCRKENVPYYIVDTEIYDIVFNIRKEKNPCSL